MKSKKLGYSARIKEAFKSMKNLLDDKKYGALRMRIELIDNDGNRQEFYLEGERASNGGWRTWQPRDHNPERNYTPEVLKKMWEEAKQRVDNYIVENSLVDGWSGCEEDLRKALESGEISLDDVEALSEVPVRGVAGYGYKAHLYAPLMTILFVFQGRHSLAQNHLSAASFCADRACYWSSEEMLIPEPEKRFSERAAAGGNAKAKLTIPVQEEVIAYFAKERTPGRWKSKQDAINDAANYLIFKHADLVKNCGLDSDKNLARTVGDWITAEPDRFGLPFRR